MPDTNTSPNVVTHHLAYVFAHQDPLPLPHFPPLRTTLFKSGAHTTLNMFEQGPAAALGLHHIPLTISLLLPVIIPSIIFFFLEGGRFGKTETKNWRGEWTEGTLRGRKKELDGWKEQMDSRDGWMEWQDRWEYGMNHT